MAAWLANRVLSLGGLIATKVRVGKSGQFSNHAVDASAQQPPGIAIRQDGDGRLSAQPFGQRSLFFYVHLIILEYSRKPAIAASGAPGRQMRRSEAVGSRSIAAAGVNAR